MKAKNAVGKKIVELQQEWTQSAAGERVYAFERMILSNGDVLYPLVYEGEGDYAVELVSLKEWKAKKRRQ